MKLRAIIVIDLEVGSHREAAEIEARTQLAVKECNALFGEYSTWAGHRLQERRGEDHPDVDTMKLIHRATA